MSFLGRRTDNLFLQQQNQKRDEAKKANAAMDEDEETLMYKPLVKVKYINEDPGDMGKTVFDESKSINKAPSIFDATAIFHVRREE